MLDIVSILVIIVGVMFVSIGELEFLWFGMVIYVIGLVCEVLRVVMI